MTRLTHKGSWELRSKKNYEYQWQWKDKLMGSSHTLLLMMISLTVSGLYYGINFNEIHQIIYLKCLQWSSITGQAQICIVATMNLGSESQAHL